MDSESCHVYSVFTLILRPPAIGWYLRARPPAVSCRRTIQWGSNSMSPGTDGPRNPAHSLMVKRHTGYNCNSRTYKQWCEAFAPMIETSQIKTHLRVPLHHLKVDTAILANYPMTPEKWRGTSMRGAVCLCLLVAKRLLCDGP